MGEFNLYESIDNNKKNLYESVGVNWNSTCLELEGALMEGEVSKLWKQYQNRRGVVRGLHLTRFLAPSLLTLLLSID